MGPCDRDGWLTAQAPRVATTSARLSASPRVRWPLAAANNHCIFMLASWMMRLYASFFCWMNAPKSLPHMAAGYRPKATNFASTSGTFNAEVNQAENCKMLSAGVVAGASRPSQTSDS